MNILITSAGRRVSLVQGFKKAASTLNLDSKVFITDLDPIKSSPAAHFADGSFKVGYFSDSDYMQILLNICLENSITIVIPTIDSELLLLAQHKSEFLQGGINVIVSSIELIKILRDKEKTITFFNDYGIKTPKIYTKDDIQFPIFLKPFNGSNSQGIYKAASIDEVKPVDLESGKMMILEYIEKKKYDEYTVDLYFDKESNLKCVVPRIRLKVVGGESNQGITRKNEVLDFVLKTFNKLPGAIGCLTLQLFSNKKNPEDIYGIEINPRFGGGFPFSLNAGASFPEFILKEYILNSEVEYFDDWKDNCLNIRYEKEVVIHD